MSVHEAFLKAVKAADHIDSKGVDAAAVAAAAALARKIDAWDVVVQWALRDAEDTSSRPKVPENDNTSLKNFQSYCESLGLTPASRSKILEGISPGAKKVDPVDELKQKRRQKAAGQD